MSIFVGSLRYALLAIAHSLTHLHNRRVAGGFRPRSAALGHVVWSRGSGSRGSARCSPWTSSGHSASSPVRCTRPPRCVVHLSGELSRLSWRCFPANPHLSGKLSRLSRKCFPASPHLSCELFHLSRKCFPASSHLLGELSRLSRKCFPASPHQSGELSHLRRNCFPASPHLPSELSHLSRKRFPASPHLSGLSGLSRLSRRCFRASQMYSTWRSLTADCSIANLMIISVDRFVIC